MKFLLFGIVVLSLICCKKDDSTNKSSLTFTKEIDIVTGITVRKNISDSPIIYGNPNSFSEKMVLYPNPVISTLKMQTSDNITNLWIVPATPELKTQEVDFSKILSSNFFDEKDIISRSIFSEQFDVEENNELSIANVDSEVDDEVTLSVAEFDLNKEISLNLRDFNPGYYKLFIKIDNDLFWDIFFIPSDAEKEESLRTDILEDFWKKVSK